MPKKTYCHRIWSKTVGICMKARAKKDGTYFWAYTLTRAYKDKQDNWKYRDEFTSRNDEALARVLSLGFKFMQENDATQLATSQTEDTQEQLH